MTVNFVVYSLMGPVVGWALDKHGSRITATLGLFFGALGFAVLATAKTLPVFYTAYAITGIGFPMVTMCSAKVVGAWCEFSTFYRSLIFVRRFLSDF